MTHSSGEVVPLDRKSTSDESDRGGSTTVTAETDRSRESSDDDVRSGAKVRADGLPSSNPGDTVQSADAGTGGQSTLAAARILSSKSSGPKLSSTGSATTSIAAAVRAAKLVSTVRASTEDRRAKREEQKATLDRLEDYTFRLKSTSSARQLGAALRIQSYVRGWQVRKMKRDTVTVDELIFTIEGRRQMYRGWRDLMAYMVFLFVFVSFVFADTQIASRYGMHSGLRSFVEKMKAPELGLFKGCTAERDVWAENGEKWCVNPEFLNFSSFLNLPSGCEQLGGITRDFTFREVSRREQALWWLQEFIKNTNNVRDPTASLILPGYEWFHSFPKELVLDVKEDANRIGNYLKIYGGQVFVSRRHPLKDCPNAWLPSFTPRCRDLNTLLQEPVGSPKPTMSFSSQTRVQCPPFLYDADFEGNILFLPGGWLFPSPEFYSINVTSALIEKYHMVDFATSSATSNFLVFNGHSQQLSSVTVGFEFGPAGDVSPIFTARSIELSRLTQQTSVLALGCLFLFSVIFMILQKCYRFYAEHGDGNLKEYCFSLWNILDCSNLVLYFISIAGAIRWEFILMKSNFETWPEFRKLQNPPVEQYTAIVSDLLFSMNVVETEAVLADYFIYVQALSLFLSMIRLFKFFQFQPRLNLVSTTLARSLIDVAHFLVTFAVMLAIFSGVGALWFGARVEGFQSFYNAFITMFSWSLGAFVTTELFAKHVMLGPVFFVIFVITNYIVMLNLFLGIVLDSYDIETSLMKQLAEQESVYTQLRSIAYRSLYAVGAKLHALVTGQRCSYASSGEKIQALLRMKQKGYSKDSLLGLTAIMKRYLPKEEVDELARLHRKKNAIRRPATFLVRDAHRVIRVIDVIVNYWAGCKTK